MRHTKVSRWNGTFSNNSKLDNYPHPFMKRRDWCNCLQLYNASGWTRNTDSVWLNLVFLNKTCSLLDLWAPLEEEHFSWHLLSLRFQCEESIFILAWKRFFLLLLPNHCCDQVISAAKNNKVLQSSSRSRSTFWIKFQLLY